MNNEPKTQEQLEQAELADAMAKVAIAKAKILAAEQAKLDVAAEAVAQYKARLEREEAEKKAWSEAVAAKWAAKQKAEQDAQLAEQHAQIVAQRHLENQFNIAQQAKADRIAAEKRLSEATAHAYALEQEARQAEAEAIRQAVLQRERDAKHETEFSDDDGTLPCEATTGIENSASALEVTPDQWGNQTLRRLFNRSEATATEQKPAVPNFTQDPQPLTNEEITIMLRQKWGAQVVDDAVAYLKTQRGVTNLQVYLSQNFKPISQ